MGILKALTRPLAWSFIARDDVQMHPAVLVHEKCEVVDVGLEEGVKCCRHAAKVTPQIGPLSLGEPGDVGLLAVQHDHALPEKVLVAIEHDAPSFARLDESARNNADGTWHRGPHQLSAGRR